MDNKIFETKANRIFEYDKCIRSIVLLSPDAKVVADFSKPGVTPLEPQSETKTVYMKATIAMSMSAPMDKYHGRIKTAILVKEKVTMICFNLLGRIMLISTSPDFQLQKVEELGRLVDQLSMG